VPGPDLTRQSKLHLPSWVTVAPITSTIRGITSEVRAGPRNGLDHDSVVSCDNITTVHRDAIHETIGLFFEEQERDLARAISEAFELMIR